MNATPIVTTEGNAHWTFLYLSVDLQNAYLGESYVKQLWHNTDKQNILHTVTQTNQPSF